MLLTVLDFGDFLVLAVMISVLAGGAAAASRRVVGSAASDERLRRIEDKLNVLLQDAGIDYVPRTKERWQRLADDGSQLPAAEEYRDTYDVTLDEAKQVVEEYLADTSEPG